MQTLPTVYDFRNSVYHHHVTHASDTEWLKLSSINIYEFGKIAPTRVAFIADM